MDRTPILTQDEATTNKQQQEQGVAIRLVETPLNISNMLPTYFYQFQSGSISEEATQMYDELIAFLETNEELIVNEQFNSREDYIKGFQKALAMIKLWIDSIYLQNSEN